MKFGFLIEREPRMSGIDMNTSDLSGNDSSDGSGRSIDEINQLKPLSLFSESPTQLGEDNFDEPFRVRSSESKIKRFFLILYKSVFF
jgi:hypothetical protein